MFWKLNSGGIVSESSITLSITLPPILGYMLIPLGLGLWEKIYFKFYEMGNNPFYIDTVIPDEEISIDENEINIDLD